MRTLEKIIAIGILLSLILKFSLISGADMIFMCTMLILACIYYPFGFLFFNQIKLRHIFKKVSYKNVTTLKIIVAVITGLGLSAIVVGALFKLLHLSGADQMLLLGLIMTAVTLVISLILLFNQNDPTSKFILWRVGIIGAIGIFLLLTPALSIVKFQYRNHPKYIEAYSNYVSDPTNEELYRKMELERERIILTEEDFKRYEESAK
jgi:hypothetical protein